MSLGLQQLDHRRVDGGDGFGGLRALSGMIDHKGSSGGCERFGDGGPMPRDAPVTMATLLASEWERLIFWDGCSRDWDGWKDL